MASLPAPLPTRPESWRIRNIKINERDAATVWLQAQIEELASAGRLGYSLALDSEQTLCATLTSSKQPIPLNGSWRLDKEFIGFTPLSETKDAKVDIVAIAGFGGQAIGSFRSRDGLSVWLRDFGPKDVPQARFITYGYKCNTGPNDGIYDLARTFLDGLAAFRHRTQTKTRPLVFVCHGLGGVLLKQALVICNQSKEAEHKELQPIEIATYGLVLMGVPNLGLRRSQLEAVAPGQVNKRIVADLLVRTTGGSTEYLEMLKTEFAQLDRRRTFEIISYYETRSSPTIVVSASLQISMSFSSID